MAKRTRNRTSRCSRKPNYPNIPEEIKDNILLMLPVKSLLRFKTVCKSWLSLISSRDFIETHLSKSTNDPHFTHHHLNISGAVDDSFMTCSVYSLLNEPADTEPVEIDHPNKDSDTVYIGVIGYSNGLVCICVDSFGEGGGVFLWNPSTRTSRRLPECGMEDSDPSYCFCYDESNNDFKVFADLLMEDGQMFVYSSKYDRWREIKNFDFLRMNGGVVFANGAIHCIVSPYHEDDSDDSDDSDDDSDDSEVPLIISFNKNMKRHRKVLQPNYGEGAHGLTLTTFGKSLSVLCGFEGAHADLWVMKNCGAEESWTKLFTIPYMDTLPSYRYMQPLCISLNGQIIMQLESLVLLYNSMANTVKVLFDNRIENRSFVDNGIEHLRARTWIESLVSPNI